MQSIAIEQIRIKVGKKTLEMSPEDAKELNRVLIDLFGSGSLGRVDHHWWWNNPTIVTYPNIIYTTSSTNNASVLEVSSGTT